MFANRVRDILKDGEPETKVNISGWVMTIREFPEFAFIELNDGSSLKGLQIVADKNIQSYSVVQSLGTGASLSVEGLLKTSKGKGQRIELHAETLVLLGGTAEDYPLQKKRHSPEFLRGIAHLRPRTKVIGASMRVRSACAQAIHDFYRKHGFYYVHTPIITASDCEGAGEMFQVTTLNLDSIPKTKAGEVDYERDFFARQSYLTVSGQLSAENLACGLGRVYTFGPTFRAEPSNTTRHISEFWMIEPEMAFADLNTDADLAEAFLQSVIGDVLERCEDDIAFFESIRKFKSPFVDMTGGALIENLIKVSQTPFVRMSYTEAVRRLEASGRSFQYPVEWGAALQTEHERYLSEELLKAPVIVTDYPASFKAFYMYLNDDQKTVRAMDVLVPRVGEIIGGSQREDRYDVLVERIKHHGLDPKDYWWYLDLRKYGTVPHAGFGLGFERLVMYLTGLKNIRDVTSFPRTPKHAEF
ncbi:MAG: asparagine--tRNA ligase [Myxococcota bacterium]|nr:asparagine--tRNA ligase [Myxococcota bacterium]